MIAVIATKGYRLIVFLSFASSVRARRVFVVVFVRPRLPIYAASRFSRSHRFSGKSQRLTLNFRQYPTTQASQQRFVHYPLCYQIYRVFQGQAAHIQKILPTRITTTP